MFQNNSASGSLAVVGRYSAPCFGIYTHNTVPPGGWKLKAPVMLYKMPKVQKQFMLLMATLLVCVACCRISMRSLSEILVFWVLAGRYGAHATAFIRTRLSWSEPLYLSMFSISEVLMSPVLAGHYRVMLRQLYAQYCPGQNKNTNNNI